MIASNRDLALKIISSQRETMIQNIAEGCPHLSDQNIREIWFAKHMDDKLATVLDQCFLQNHLTAME